MAVSDHKIDAAFSTIANAVDRCCRVSDHETVQALHARILELRARVVDRVRLIDAARNASGG